MGDWRRFVIEVPPDMFAALSSRAHRERRSVKDQAVWLLEQTLLGRQAVELPTRPTELVPG